MASVVVIPTIYWSAYSDVDTACTISSEYTLTKIYAAMNSPRYDLYYLWSHADQPITIDHGASFTFPTLFTGSASAFFIRAEAALANTLTSNYNWWKFYTGSSAAGTLRTPAAVYGDGVINTNQIEYDSPVTTTYVNTIGVYGDDYTDRYHRLTLGNDGTPGYTSFKLYEFMIGHAVSLPDGWLREEREVSWDFVVGDIKAGYAGYQTWSGQWAAAGGRKSFEYSCNGVNQATRDLWRTIFQYSRGCLPVVIMEDSNDTTSIMKVRLTDYQDTEDGQAWSLTIGVEEI